MRLPYLILLGLFLFIAGAVLAGGAMFVLAHPRGDFASTFGGGKEEIVVLAAKHKMTQWSIIRSPAESFEGRVILKRHAPTNIISEASLAALKGRRLRATLDEGTVLTEDHLLAKEMTGLDGMLDRGKRAMAVPITADKAAGFFVVPGSKVDVIQTGKGIPGANVVLENVLVLAVDQMTSRAEDRVGAVGASATLQMDNMECVLKLAAALERGTVRLVLRPPNDEGQFEKGDGIPALPPPIAPPPPPFDDK